MAANAKLRMRATFSFSDQKRLMLMVTKYSGVLECKKTDKHTWQQKEDAWMQLANDFNSGVEMPKTKIALQAKFRNMKRDYRACIAKQRQSLYATGGGPADKIETYPFSEEMEKLLELSAKGLCNEFDSDALEPEDKQEDQEQPAKERKEDVSDYEENPAQELSDPSVETRDTSMLWEGYVPVGDSVRDWSHYSPEMLKHPINKALVVLKESTRTSGSSSCTSNPDTTANFPVESIAKSSNDGKSNPFKAVKNRPSLKSFQEAKRSATGAKYIALAEQKTKLTACKINFVARELAMKEERHRKEMELLQIKIEAEKLELEIKKMQFSKLKTP